MRRLITITLTALVLLVSLAGVSSALGSEGCGSCRPWWHFTSSTRPTYLSPEGEGQIVIAATNLGDGADGATAPVTIADTLPAGLKAVSVAAKSTSNGGIAAKCSSSKSTPLTCTFAGILPPYIRIEVDIGVKVSEGAHSGELNQVSLSSAQTASASLARPIAVSEEPVPFGLNDNELTPEEEGGVPDTQAGSHPFQVTNTLLLNQNVEVRNGVRAPVPVALPKNLNVKLPPGLIGNPTSVPRCSLAQFLTLVSSASELIDDCPAQTAVGVAVVNVYEPGTLGLATFTLPVFNLQPSFGEPARFGFFVGEADTPVLLDPSLRSGDGEDYGITLSSLNTSQTAALLASEVTFWGTPGDPRHDSVRGYGCLLAARGFPTGPNFPCTALGDQRPQSLLTLPTACTGAPLQSSIDLSSWADPNDVLPFSTTQPMVALDGCNRLSFSPTISAEPTTDRASAPSGLDVNLDFHDEGLTSAEGLAQSQLKDTTVTLPEGFTINPSAGVGLGGCTTADYANETLQSAPSAGCPNDSKLGSVEIETPLLTQKILGSIFIAEPHENPFNSLVALYIVAKNPETGVLIKLAGKVTPNPVTGQLVTTFENNPQLPFDHFNFHFREGQQAPLISPPTCGTFATQAQLTPWSDPTAHITDSSTFTITKGFDGGACPAGGVPPFAPQIQSGTLNNNAGAFSPFYVRLTRSDGDSEISAFSTNLPPGLVGILSGIPFCPEADIALARTKTGVQEEADPSCPAASQLGHTLVGTGVGAVLAYTPGRIYLAGPYNGDPFSLVSVTSAVVGPFDLGTVVIHFGLHIDPHTIQVSVDPTASEPIPDIIQGIVTHVRDIRVYIDRPNFTLNPTNCNPLAISSTLTSNLGQSATVSSHFQAANCANLKFAPKFSVSTAGKTSKANGASLITKLSYPSGSLGADANIAKVKVELPKQLPSRLTTLQKACTSAQFEANPAGCPPASFIGHAIVHTPLLPVPLIGPAIFVSHGGEAFPSLVIVLQGYGVTADLVGTTFISKAGVTSTTFKTVPDTPFSTFELTLPQGSFSALTSNLPASAKGSFCGQKLVMPSEFVAQNGAVMKQNTPVTAAGCAKKKALSRKQKLAAAMKACRRKAKGKRGACQRQARRRFGTVKKQHKKK